MANSPNKAEAAVAAIINVEPVGSPDSAARDPVEMSVVLFRYNPLSFEVQDVIDSYCRTGTGADALDAERISEMLEAPSVLIAHSAEYARSFVCRLLPRPFTRRWRCTDREIGWNRFGVPDTQLDNLLKHFQIESDNSAFGLLKLLKLTAPDGRTFLAHLLQEV